MKTWLRIGALAILLGAAGCETDDRVSADDIDAALAQGPAAGPEGYRYIRITPNVATVTRTGQQVEFQVDGGTAPYEWQVSVPANGAVQPTRVNEALYTTRVVADNEVIVLDRAGRSAVARVLGEPSAEQALTARATPSLLENDGDRAVLTAQGGSPPYRWAVMDAALGMLDSDSGATVSYTRLRRGDNAVRVTDSLGATVVVVIRQP